MWTSPRCIFHKTSEELQQGLTSSDWVISISHVVCQTSERLVCQVFATMIWANLGFLVYEQEKTAQTNFSKHSADNVLISTWVYPATKHTCAFPHFFFWEQTLVLEGIQLKSVYVFNAVLANSRRSEVVPLHTISDFLHGKMACDPTLVHGVVRHRCSADQVCKSCWRQEFDIQKRQLSTFRTFRTFFARFQRGSADPSIHGQCLPSHWALMRHSTFHIVPLVVSWCFTTIHLSRRYYFNIL